MPDAVFTCLNVECLTEKIIHARRGICYASPGVYDWVAEALIEAAQSLGWEGVRIVLDPSPDVIRFGYGTQKAIDRLRECGASVRVQEGLRIAVVTVDDFAAIFSPTPLNIEMFPDGPGLWNAVTIRADEAERLIRAIAPEMQDVNGDRAPEIGQEEMSERQVEIMRTSLRDSPPEAPDLARLLQVINSQFQIIKISFEGARLSQHKVPIKAEELGIEDDAFARRISAGFRLFEPDIDQYIEPLRQDLERIKRLYDLKPLGDLGHVVFGKVRWKLDNELATFKAHLDVRQKDLEKVLQRKLDEGKERLRALLRSKLPKDEANQGDLDMRIDWMIGRIGFPEPEKILSKLRFDWSVLNISDQMVKKGEFVKKIEDLYGKRFEEMVNIETVVGLRGGSSPAGEHG